MKTELFKKLIKEAVREVIREELNLEVQKTVKATNSQEQKEFSKDNSINEMLNMTKNSMKDSDYRNVLNMDSSNAKNFNPVSDFFTPNQETSFQNQPGLDISTLDFVKKASTVYKKSLELDSKR